jgi:curved DNA-binding protein
MHIVPLISGYRIALVIALAQQREQRRSMQPQDYYTLLGVDRTASAYEVRLAYRRLAFQYHPDLHPEDPSTATNMRLLNEAVAVLTDQAKRMAYNQTIGYVHVAPQAAVAQPPGVHNGDMIGQRDGYDVTYAIAITYAEARTGTYRELHFHSADGNPYAIPVEIPSGTLPGTRLCLKAMGGPGLHGGRRGDLSIVIEIVNDR